MASVSQQPILAVLYITTMLVMVSSLNVFGPVAPQNTNDPPPTTSIPIPPPTCNNQCPCPVAGSPGAAGIPGMHGTNGNHGLPGAQGPVGASGTQGNSGQDGKDGATGIDGKDGAAGIDGNTGAAGPPGLDGDKGPTGPVGTSGPKGDKGDMGQDGTNGAPGDKGAQGDTGSKGEPGNPYTPPSLSVFVAHRTSDFEVTSGNKIIGFEVMKLNIGGDFNPTTGLFTCRIPGLYYFTFNFYPVHNAEGMVDVYLTHNGVNVAYLYVQGGTSARISGSQSTILDLDIDDEVLLRAYAFTRIYGSTDGRSAFTGYLLQETTSAFMYNSTSWTTESSPFE